MRHKIAFRLALSFLLLTLASALVIGVVFTFMFRDHVVTAKKEEMLARARAAATTLSQDTWSGAMGMGRGGPQRERFGSALQLLDDMSLGHTWIVDESLQLITAGRGAHAPSYAQLPQDADAVVREVFAGNTVFSEQFSGLMDAATLTLGYPVVRNGQVSAALLMHEPVSGISQAFVNGSSMLMYSLLAALALSALISVPLAKRLVRPLQQMKTTALRLAQGDYQAQTGVRSRDEIGELAQALDTLSLRLEEARQESDRLEKLRRDFIANISHELRTPVTVIHGSLEALSEGVDGALLWPDAGRKPAAGAAGQRPAGFEQAAKRGLSPADGPGQPGRRAVRRRAQRPPDGAGKAGDHRVDNAGRACPHPG